MKKTNDNKKIIYSAFSGFEKIRVYLYRSARHSKTIRHYGVALFAGAMGALALAPFHLLALCFISFPILIWLLECLYANKNTPLKRQIVKVFLTGWSFGFGYFVAGLWWLGHAVLIDAGVFSLVMLPLAVVGLPAFLALYWGLATLLQFFMCYPLKKWQGYGRIVALALAFVVAEWLRSVLFTGFPWNAIGYTAMPTPLLMQISALVGLDGVNGLAVLLYATPAMIWSSNRFGKIIGLSLAGSLVVFILLFGWVRLYDLPAIETLAQAPGIRVRLVQPSIAQSDKHDPVTDGENFARHLQLTRAPPLNNAPLPDLVVWPETSLPYVLSYAPEALSAIAANLQEGQLALVGSVRAEWGEAGTPAYYNALEIIDAHGNIIGHANKAHLVPFGEYLPFQAFFAQFGLGGIAETVGGYSAAQHLTSIRLNETTTILPLICYEVIFHNQLDYEGEKANVIINISNDAWYGATPGPTQHFHQARLRSIEQGKSMIRVANNGISAAIDPYGRIITKLELDEIGFVDVNIPLATVSSWYKYTRNLPVFCLFFVLLTISCNIKTFLSTYKLIKAIK